MIQEGDTVRSICGKFWPYGSETAKVVSVLNGRVYFEKEAWVWAWQVERVS